MLSAAPGLVAVTDRDPAALSPYQVEALKTVGVTSPPADALATAAILVDRQFAADVAEKPFADRLVEEWTSLALASEKYGKPCDVANAKCLASAQSNARALAPILQERWRDFAVLVMGLRLSKRFTIAELATVKAFVVTPAGKKMAPQSFVGESAADDPRWKPVAGELDALIDGYRRRFIDETKMLTRAEVPPVTPPPPWKAKP
ncbi:MAG: hypothetical protein ABIS51_11870 [Sphingomonas sp.]